MKVDIFMPLYVGDYLRDTMHLTAEQHGAYFLLLLHYWVRGSALPDDDAYLGNVSKVEPQVWLKLRPTLARFFSIRDGQWFHGRVERELELAHRRRESFKIRSEKGVAARKAKHQEQPEVELEGQHQVAPAPNLGSTTSMSMSPSPIDIDNKADGKPGYSFRALQLANLIIGNSTAWHYDNCKVEIAELSSRSLASVIEPFIKKFPDDGKLAAAWHEAVRIAHGAAVDGLARNPTGYAIQCFKEQMKNSP